MPASTIDSYFQVMFDGMTQQGQRSLSCYRILSAYLWSEIRCVIGFTEEGFYQSKKIVSLPFPRKNEHFFDWIEEVVDLQILEINVIFVFTVFA